MQGKIVGYHLNAVPSADPNRLETSIFANQGLAEFQKTSQATELCCAYKACTVLTCCPD